MSRLAILSAAAAAMSLALAAGTAGAAKPFHANFSDTFTDTVCGIPITGTSVGVENFTGVFDAAGNLVAFKDIVQAKVTFTAANGKSVVVAFAGPHTGTATVNPDGSTTFVDTFKGLPEKIFVPGGPVITRDAGLITFTNVVAPDGTLVSHTTSAHGPHPEADSDFVLFCQVVTAALS